MSRSRRHPLIAGIRITSLGTLTSRVLGMCRDIATAALLGLAGGGVMDAFVIAYRIPNLFRRLFGEGALTASYLPALSAQLEKDRKGAWQLASVTFTWLTMVLAALVVLGEVLFALVWLLWGDAADVELLVGLAAVMLPYLLLICLAAQVTATLHALSHFSVPAFTPVVLNVCWLLAAWLAASHFDRQSQQAYVLAVGVLVAGVLQLGVQLPVLRRMGFRFDYNWSAARSGLGQIGRALAPMLAGLAVTQINTFFDSLIAWGLAAPVGVDGPQPIAWLGGAVRYPMEQGAAAAIYYGERLYHFPLGVLGMAVAAAIFPLLSRHAARGDRHKLGTDLTLGLRLVLCLGVPAGAGLIILAHPLARLLFERGQFTPHDTTRAAWMIACYGTGVWAFCALPVVIRGFYALGDCGRPAKIAAWVVGLNLTLNLSLIWTPLEEAGLAVATSLSAGVQVLVLMLIFSRRKGPLGWTALAATAGRTVLCTLLMAAVGWATLYALGPPTATDGLIDKLARVLLPLLVSVAAYFASYWLSRGRELAILFGSGPAEDGTDDYGEA
ncbi:MAG: murein biosynthesis integral membrane protein MurJ [Planctomycetota bacterium]|jgi:putative peptidoglycan lipid II flippase